jgi:DNA-binding response OmpR family regulator
LKSELESSKNIDLIVVEDNETLRHELCDFLSEEGFVVRAVDSGESLNQALRERFTDILVLDLNMADEDGISIAKRIRIHLPQVGIIMLTGRVLSKDRVEGYQSGADIYITKPARPAELVAAIRNLAGRLMPVPVHFPWVLDTVNLTLRYQLNVPIALTSSEASILKTLALNASCVSHVALIESTAPSKLTVSMSRASLEVLISRLRTKISWYTGPLNPIKSVRGMGYQLCIKMKIQ